MYRFVQDFNSHPGILCTTCKNISWNTTDVAEQYCPTCHRNYHKFNDNLDYKRADGIQGKIKYTFNYLMKPNALFHDVDEDCPACDEGIEREDIDPIEPGVQTKMSLKLKKIKDPKERSKEWLKSIKK